MRGQSKTTKLSKTREKRGRPSRDWFLILRLIGWQVSGPITKQSKAKPM